MSSHLSDFILLYKRFGIDCVVNKENSGYYIKLIGDTFVEGEDDLTQSIYLDGHIGFYSILHFDHEGRFLSQEFRE